MERQPHVMLIPLPAQGHVAPMMKLALQIAAHGVKVTFVNTEFIHARIKASVPQNAEKKSLINFVSLPDGLGLEDDRTNPAKLRESVNRNMPSYVEDLILNINNYQSNMNQKITCVVADFTLVEWAHKAAMKSGIKAILFVPNGGALLALAVHIPKLLEDGIIDNEGTIMTAEPISLSKDVPTWSNSDVIWASSDPKLRKLVFNTNYSIPKYARFYDLILCNTVYELDSAALQLVPKISTIGPLLASNDLTTFAGNLWLEDSTCIEWLDKQTSGSVIYVAFGSTTKANMQQIEEIALGLELSGQPFLWVVRSNFMDGSLPKFPEEFINRVVERAKLVEWAPQDKVLAHPSVACFISHCGWNSTIEGLTRGVPFLCWPYFCDQFCNKKYICDVWKIGLELVEDRIGILTRHEVSRKIKTLLSSDTIKANALRVKEVARKSLGEGGSSSNNFKNFIQHIKNL